MHSFSVRALTRLVAFVAFSLPVISRGDVSTPPVFRITDLGVIPGKTVFNAFGINDLGQVTGSADDTVFLWSRSTGMLDLGKPAGFDSAFGSEINNNGQIAVGTSKGSGPNFQGRAFRWTSGVFQDMGTLGGVYSSAHGIDGSGRIAGYSYTTTPNVWHAYRSTSGDSLVDIDSMGGNFSFATGINESGHVVGRARLSNGQEHAFLWNGFGSMQDLGTLGGSTSEANDISDSGIVVGVSFTSQLAVHAFKWQNGVMADFGSPTPFNSRAYAVNDSAQIVGNYSDGVTTQPLYWDGAGVMYDLNTVLDPITGAGWNLRHAFNINNRGQIVGQGIHDGALRAYLLTPVPEPPPTVLLLIAAAAAAMVRRVSLNKR